MSGKNKAMGKGQPLRANKMANDRGEIGAKRRGRKSAVRR